MDDRLDVKECASALLECAELCEEREGGLKCIASDKCPDEKFKITSNDEPSPKRMKKFSREMML